MDAALLALAEALGTLGPPALLGLGLILVVVGTLRPGKLVDAERERIIAERDKREADREAEWHRREAILIAERDAWRDRSIATDDRLDRVAAAFSRMANAPAPD